MYICTYESVWHGKLVVERMLVPVYVSLCLCVWDYYDSRFVLRPWLLYIYSTARWLVWFLTEKARPVVVLNSTTNVYYLFKLYSLYSFMAWNFSKIISVQLVQCSHASFLVIVLSYNPSKSLGIQKGEL